MRPGEIEQVSEELAANLPVCPKCGDAPVIYRRSSTKGVDVAIICTRCNENWYPGIRGPYPLPEDWHPSLFEAVNIWSLTAKLLGSEEPATQQGQLYVDQSTGKTWVWDHQGWIVVSDPTATDVPF